MNFMDFSKFMDRLNEVFPDYQIRDDVKGRLQEMLSQFDGPSIDKALSVYIRDNFEATLNGKPDRYFWRRLTEMAALIDKPREGDDPYGHTPSEIAVIVKAMRESKHEATRQRIHGSMTDNEVYGLYLTENRYIGLRSSTSPNHDENLFGRYNPDITTIRFRGTQEEDAAMMSAWECASTEDRLHWSKVARHEFTAPQVANKENWDRLAKVKYFVAQNQVGGHG